MLAVHRRKPRLTRLVTYRPEATPTLDVVALGNLTRASQLAKLDLSPETLTGANAEELEEEQLRWLSCREHTPKLASSITSRTRRPSSPNPLAALAALQPLPLKKHEAMLKPSVARAQGTSLQLRRSFFLVPPWSHETPTRRRVEFWGRGCRPCNKLATERPP